MNRQGDRCSVSVGKQADAPNQSSQYNIILFFESMLKKASLPITILCFIKNGCSIIKSLRVPQRGWSLRSACTCCIMSCSLICLMKCCFVFLWYACGVYPNSRQILFILKFVFALFISRTVGVQTFFWCWCQVVFRQYWSWYPVHRPEVFPRQVAFRAVQFFAAVLFDF